MADIYSKQITSNPSDRPRSTARDNHGKVRTQFFEVVNDSGAALAVGDTIALCDLPPGAVRVLPSQSFFSGVALGAAAEISIGHEEYRTTSESFTDPQPASPDALSASVDLGGTTNSEPMSDRLKFDLYSKAGVRVTADVIAGTIPIDGEMSGYITYVYE